MITVLWAIAAAALTVSLGIVANWIREPAALQQHPKRPLILSLILVLLGISSALIAVGSSLGAGDGQTTPPSVASPPPSGATPTPIANNINWSGQVKSYSGARLDLDSVPPNPDLVGNDYIWEIAFGFADSNVYGGMRADDRVLTINTLGTPVVDNTIRTDLSPAPVYFRVWRDRTDPTESECAGLLSKAPALKSTIPEVNQTTETFDVTTSFCMRTAIGRIVFVRPIELVGDASEPQSTHNYWLLSVTAYRVTGDR